MRRVLPLIVLLSLAFTPAPFPKDLNKIDLRKMQGEWVQVREESAHFGITYPKGALLIVGNKVIKSDWSGAGAPATIVLDATRSPKLIEHQYPASVKINISRHSYRLVGDLLELCYDPANHNKAPST
jgi:uncharacterized protein (TIGR03067 family)